MPQRSNSPAPEQQASRDDRRVARRLKADAVSWIKAVKPTVGGPGRLVDISKTGILLETNIRMLPGRRTTLLLVNHEDKKERVDAVVVRTQLVSIPSGGDPVYRTALTFPRELELPIPEGEEPPPAAAVALSPALGDEELVTEIQAQPRLDGPFDGLWATQSGSQIVAVSNITESGCTIQTSESVAVGEWASVSVFFSPVRQLLLKGKVASLTADQQGCVVRFADLTAEQRRALRVEIRGRVPGSAPKTPTASLPRLFAVRSRTQLVEKSFSVSLQANDW